MFKPVQIIFFVAAIFLAGCAGNSIHQLPPSELESTNVVHEFFEPQLPKSPAPIIQTNLLPKITSNPAPATTWASLTRWAAENKTGAPHRISDTPVAEYAIGSKNGAMVLEIGSREATWNGIQISLGFAPQIIDGEIYLHELDLQKNLEPLLCELPISFPQTNRVIVIDPGHGGSNVGTHSVLDGRFEKEFTLDLALRLKPLLETNGWRVFLTRTSDVYVTNSYRAVFAAAHHTDLFISLHFNSAAPDTKQAGLETYCLTPTGMPSTLTRGYEDNWSEILPDNFFDAQNLQLAVKIHSAILRATGEEDRGVRRARFIEVLRGQNCPAILIEAGYLSNPAEAKMIESSEYRQKLAETLADALK